MGKIEKEVGVIRGFLGNIDAFLSNYLPLEKIYYTLLVVYISIATNDIRLPHNSYIRRNYPAHLLIIFVLSYLSLDIGNKELFQSKILAALIVTFVFYMITRPQKYDIFNKDFYFGVKSTVVPKAT